jgi:hypothetical protein
MQNNASFLAMPEDPWMITRLIDELREASREFREDPRAYVKGAIKGDATGGERRTTLFRLGLAIAILFYAIVFGATLLFWSFKQCGGRVQFEVSGSSDESRSRRLSSAFRFVW